MKKRTIRVACPTSNSNVDSGHEISVSMAPWETSQEPFVNRDRDGNDVLEDFGRIKSQEAS